MLKEVGFASLVLIIRRVWEGEKKVGAGGVSNPRVEIEVSDMQLK